MFAPNSIVKIDPPYQGRRFLKFYQYQPAGWYGNSQTFRDYYWFGPHDGPDWGGGHMPGSIGIDATQLNVPGRPYTLSKPIPGDVIGGKRRRKTQRRRRG
jgi:hypothetical protein